MTATAAIGKLGVCLLAAALAAGCDHSDNSGAGEPASTNEDAAAVAQAPATDPNFPDGLHPDAAANRTIASVFAGALGGTPSADNDANTIVCLGDSVTAAGYPDDLASITGKNAVNEGRPGESAGGGTARVAGVLAAYKPGFLCILYGFNDVNGHRAPADVAESVREIVEAAKANGTVPVVGTLTPVSGDYADLQSAIDDLNAELRAMASSEGVAVADLAAAF